MALLRPSTWPKRAQLAVPAAAAAVAFALQSIAGFDLIDLSAWQFALITAGGFVGAFFAVWLPLGWERGESRLVETQRLEIEKLKDERERDAKALMFAYLKNLFGLVDYTEGLARISEERRAGFEQSIKERTVHAVEACAGDVPEARVTFFHLDGSSRLCVSYHSGSARGALADVPFNSKHGEYLLEATKVGRGEVEANLRRRNAIRWPTPRNFQTLVYFPVRTPTKVYGILMIDAPEPGVIEKRHLNLLAIAARHAAAGLALCETPSTT
ncbi:hypothetical protein [Streptomyces sp. NPDC013457]|uniref:hypothetical protein n=1 Tax=Streptomyces sp. NPDC013457 TaxID=3364866 RepID=UPI0036FA6E07